MSKKYKVELTEQQLFALLGIANRVIDAGYERHSSWFETIRYFAALVRGRDRIREVLNARAAEAMRAYLRLASPVGTLVQFPITRETSPDPNASATGSYSITISPRSTGPGLFGSTEDMGTHS